MNLREIQTAFQHYLLEQPSGIEAQIVSSEKVPTAERLNVYRYAYGARLVECLESDYEALHTLLGDDTFATLCREYISTHPSSYRSVRWFGDQLAEFVRNTPPYNEQTIIAEMAEFEWAFTLIFDSSDAETVTIDQMGQIAPDAWAGLQLNFHSCLQRLDLEWSVPQFWQAVIAEKKPEPPAKSEYPIPWLLWRQDNQPYFRSMEVDEAWALDAARKGASFGELCEGLSEWLDEEHIPHRAAGFLHQWINDRLVTALLT